MKYPFRTTLAMLLGLTLSGSVAAAQQTTPPAASSDNATAITRSQPTPPAVADSQIRIVRLSDVQSEVQVDRNTRQGLAAPVLPDSGAAKQAAANAVDCGTFAAGDARLDLVSRLCEFALTYRHQLPDFIAQQTTTLHGPRSKTVMTEQVTFRKGLEHYSHVTINGKPVPPNNSLPRNIRFTSSGEFGSLLVDLFVVPGTTEFKFRKTATLNGTPVAIYDFRVPTSKNTFWTLRDPTGQTLRPEFQGQLWLEEQTGRPLREELEPIVLADITGISSAKVVTDYAMTTVGDAGTFLLPVQSESTVCTGSSLFYNSCTTNILVFHDYRKFVATARILTSGSQP